MEITFTPTKKQHQAWLYLQDKTTSTILFGGAVGGGKSYLGCMWLFLSCIQFPGTRWLMGRSRLNNIKRTTYRTFVDITKKFNYTHWGFNSQNNVISFQNGSEIILYDLFPYPNDPEYDRLGSLEISGAFIDELSEISYKGFEVLSSRIRYKLSDYNLTPKLFCASNPCQGWSKNYFFTPYKENRLPEHVQFVQSLPTENPHLSREYLKNLEVTLDQALKQRLLYGDWDFSGDEYNLFQYEKLQQCFYNDIQTTGTTKRYLTCDIGDLGSDKTIIGVWTDWKLMSLHKLSQKETTEVVTEIRRLMAEYRVPINQVIVDSVGVGAGTASLLKGCVRYAGSERPLNGEKFKNIKAQMMYKFADKVNRLEVSFGFPYDDGLIQEALLYKKVFSNEVSSITPKDEIRQRLGHSPDIIDSIYLRAYFDYKKVNAGSFAII